MSKENEESMPIEINLEQHEYDSLIGIFVINHLSEASQLVFNDYLVAGDSVPLSLSRAVINEMVNIALAEELERGTLKETLNTQPNEEDK